MSKPLALPFQTAKQLAAAIRKKKIGCLELLDLYLKRVEAFNPELNAIIASDVDGARKRAKAADKAIKAGKKLGPLHGVPMTIKESYDVAGYATTFGDPAFKDNIAKTNSMVAQRMIDAGVTLFGKTNVPLNLADWQSYNEVYGSTNNPWDLSRTPGGSSGGSGAALAAGLTGIAAAVGHLLRLGHRRLAHLAGPSDMTTGFVRERAFRQAVAARGLDPVVIGCDGYTIESGKRGMSALLSRRGAHPTGIVAGNDLIAIGALHALRERGLRCPQDISLVGFNDMPFADELQPPLTTVHVPHHEMGAEAARMLLDELDGAPATGKTVILPLTLVVRGSTAPPP